MDHTGSPLVSVACVAYNHERYIRETIEGFLAQITTFPIEIIIHDDASTDRTAEIIAEYARAHPDVIHPIFQTENQYSKGGHPLLDVTLPRCRGKYIAICEGDDYWTDPSKLEMQVGFLETHADHALVHTDYIVYEEASGTFLRSREKKPPSGLVFEQLIESNFIATLTVMLRKDVFDAIDLKDEFDQAFVQGDYPLWLEFSKRGKIHYLDRCTAVYRVLPESASHSANFTKKQALHASAIRVGKYFAKKYGYERYDEAKAYQAMNYDLAVTALYHTKYEEARHYTLHLVPDTLLKRILIAGCSAKLLFYLMSGIGRLRLWFLTMAARRRMRAASSGRQSRSRIWSLCERIRTFFGERPDPTMEMRL